MEPTKEQVIGMKKTLADNVHQALRLAQKIGKGYVRLQLTDLSSVHEFEHAWHMELVGDDWVFETEHYGASFRIHVTTDMLIDVHFDKLDSPLVRVYIGYEG